MVKLKDIAEVCGVSVATVSRALNGITKNAGGRTQNILQTAADMGYTPDLAARALRTSISNNIGIIYESRMNHEYFSSLFDELRLEAERLGYDLTFISRDSEKEYSYYERARQRGVDGLIVAQADYEAAAILRLATSSIPTVVVDHEYEGVDCVIGNNRRSVEEIVRHVYDLGHRKLAFIQGEKNAVSRERLAGFYKICAELGIRVPADYICEGRFHDPGECARFIWGLMQKTDRPTCILCPDDYSCIGAIWLLAKEGVRVPQDISLVGYDGIMLSQMVEPRLTTYCQDTRQIAREVFGMLIDAIESPDKHVPRKIMVPGKLIGGETVFRLE